MAHGDTATLPVNPSDLPPAAVNASMYTTATTTLPAWTRAANHFNTVIDALLQLRKGGAVVVMDDESRENEGDLVMAAEFASLAAIAFFCRYSSGLLCAPLTQARAAQLNLPPMVASNTDRNQTAFTVSVDCIHGTTTGASAGDRAVTAKALADPAAAASDFSRPGHLFPLVAKPGGVLERTGHTEASVDLLLLAQLQPVAVIGELMRADGTMMRLAECRAFAAKFDLPIISVEQLIAFRRAIPGLSAPLGEGCRLSLEQLAELAAAAGLSGTETAPFSDIGRDADVILTAECVLPVDLSWSAGAPNEAIFTLKVFRHIPTDTEHLVLTKGSVERAERVLTRIHSVCVTGDILGSMRCDCGPQLREALAVLAREPTAILIYVRDHEGRGIGITQKVRAYALQQQHGLDTYEANAALGLPHDCRDYSAVNAILAALNVQSVELLTNNPSKVNAVEAVEVSGVRALRPLAHHDHHASYLRTKQQHETDVLQALLQTGLAPGGRKGHLAGILSSIVSQASSTATSSAEGSESGGTADLGVDVEDAIDAGNGSLGGGPSTGAHSPKEIGNVVITTTAEVLATATNATISSTTVTQPIIYTTPSPLPDGGQSRLDAAFMRHALRLALRGRVTAPPNPWVGCVLVRDGLVIGEGWHHRAGEPHAEVMALTDAAQRYCAARGDTYAADQRAQLVLAAAHDATAYVTLEPCHHFGRTGPCDEALIAAKIARVVVAVVDPDARVSSQGLARLRAAGMDVTTGVCADEVAEAMRPYLHQRQHKRAYCVVKTALSIDGKMACADKTSQWITGAAARRHAHLLRAKSQAVLVGAETAVVDQPRLTPRISFDDFPEDAETRAQLSERRAQPLLRVVLDGRGRVVSGPLLETAENPTLVFTSSHCPQAIKDAWTAAGVQYVVAPGGEQDSGAAKAGLIDLRFVLETLAQRGILQVMVEGGASLHGAFLQSGLVDELHVYTGAKLLGASALSWPSKELASTIGQAEQWQLQSVTRIDQHEHDVLCIYRPGGGGAAGRA